MDTQVYVTTVLSALTVAAVTGIVSLIRDQRNASRQEQQSRLVQSAPDQARPQQGQGYLPGRAANPTWYLSGRDILRRMLTVVTGVLLAFFGLLAFAAVLDSRIPGPQKLAWIGLAALIFLAFRGARKI